MPNISKIFNGYILPPIFMDTTSGARPKPPPNKMWLVLGGRVHHETGTATIVCITNEKDSPRDYLCEIPAATATGEAALFSTVASSGQSQGGLHFVATNQQLFCTGDAAAYVWFNILEFEYQ